MAYPIDPATNAHLKDLEQNMDVHAANYRVKKSKELVDGHKGKLLKELEHLQHYLDAYHAGMIDDVTTNATFARVKLGILEELLGVSKAPASDQTHQLSREQLKTLAQAIKHMKGPDGHIRDTIGFAHRILSTLHTADGKRINKIRIFISDKEGQTTCAFFNDHNARVSGSNTRECQITQKSDGTVVITCTPALSREEHHSCLKSLATHLSNYDIA